MIVAGLAHLEGATLPMLHALQDEFGYVDPQAVPLIAEALNLSRAEVHGAISFYHDFKTTPQPARIVKLCRAEACQAMGSDRLAAELERQTPATAEAPQPKPYVGLRTLLADHEQEKPPAA